MQYVLPVLPELLASWLSHFMPPNLTVVEYGTLYRLLYEVTQLKAPISLDIADTPSGSKILFDVLMKQEQLDNCHEWKGEWFKNVNKSLNQLLLSRFHSDKFPVELYPQCTLWTQEVVAVKNLLSKCFDICLRSQFTNWHYYQYWNPSPVVPFNAPPSPAPPAPPVVPSNVPPPVTATAEKKEEKKIEPRRRSVRQRAVAAPVEQIDKFVEALKAAHYTDRTIGNYRRTIQHYLCREGKKIEAVVDENFISTIRSDHKKHGQNGYEKDHATASCALRLFRKWFITGIISLCRRSKNI